MFADFESTKIAQVKYALSQSKFYDIGTPDVHLVDMDGLDDAKQLNVKIQAIKYDSQDNAIQISINVQELMDVLRDRTVIEDLEDQTNSQDSQILELVQLLRAYQRKEKGTATKANDLLSTKYRNVG